MKKHISNNWMTRFLAMLTAAALVLTSVDVTAFAAMTETEPSTVEQDLAEEPEKEPEEAQPEESEEETEQEDTVEDPEDTSEDQNAEDEDDPEDSSADISDDVSGEETEEETEDALEEQTADVAIYGSRSAETGKLAYLDPTVLRPDGDGKWSSDNGNLLWFGKETDGTPMQYRILSSTDVFSTNTKNNGLLLNSVKKYKTETSENWWGTDFNKTADLTSQESEAIAWAKDKGGYSYKTFVFREALPYYWNALKALYADDTDETGINGASLYMDLSKVLMVSKTGSMKYIADSELHAIDNNIFYQDDDWKLTLLDSDKSVTSAILTYVGKDADTGAEKYQISCTYEGEANDKLSIMVTDKAYDEDGVQILCYGYVNSSISSNQKTDHGDGSYTLDGTFSIGKNTGVSAEDLKTSYHMYLIVEKTSGQYNNNLYGTDYASQPYEVQAGESETHYMCGYTGTSQSEHRKLHPSCGWLYNEYTFKPWNRTGSLPTEPGYYYLVNDVELTETWNVPAGRTYLCMSGKNITMKGDGAVISVAKGANLLMTDCKEEENKITHSEGQGSGIAISSKGKAYLCGIKITGNKAEKGGGIYCESADENSFQVSRNTIIDGNTALDGTASNVYLGKDQRIYVWDPGEKMRIGATTEVQPTEEKPVTITKFGKVTDANYVFSDQNYDIGDVEEDNSGWTRRNLILVPRATAVTDTNVDGTTGNRSLGLGTSIMRNPAIPTENDDWSGSYVWFGYDYQYNSQYNPGKPIKYRVLSKNTTELGKNGENTLFLDSDHLMIDERKYDQNTNSGNAVISYMSSYYGYAKEAEKKAFVNSTITETGKEDYPFFILTSEQARSGRYGYSNSDTGAGRIKSSRYGSIYKWWLHGGESYVTTDGTIVQDKDVNAGGGIATNINLSNILLSEVVAGEAGKLNAEYKLTVLAGKADAGEENMKVTLDTTENIQRTEDEVTVSYELSHYVKQGYSETAKYYRINQVAVLFLDKEYTEGNTNQAHLLGYANVDEKEFKDYPPYRYDEGFEGSYTKKFVVPDDLKDKKCGEDYYAYLIAVQENGENETDFASEPVEITIPKATRGVKHTTRDEEKTYDGNTIDVTELFTLDSVLKPYLDSNRVTVTYNLLSGAEDPEVTGEGTLTADHKLTVTKCGIFKIKVTTGVVYDEENDPIYGAGEVTATLTVDKAKGTASVSVPDTVTYGDTYTVTASSDTNTGTNPVFTYAKNLSDGTSEILAGQPKDAGTYTVTAHFAATDLYEACAATETFTIQPRAAVLEWSGTELVYNGKEQSVTATVKNALSGDTFDLKYAGNKETDVSDQYKAVVTELGNPNYTFENADDAVHPWKIQYLDTSADIIYQGTPGEDDWYQNVTLKAPEGYEISFNDGTTWLSTLPYSREGQYILYYCLREKSTGYITAERSTKVLKIDTTAPTGDIQVKDTSIKADSDAGIWNLIKKIFFKEKVEITAVGSDSVSKASKLEYQTVANDASFDKDGTWKAVAASAGSEGSITGSFEVAAKYKGRVFIRVTDQAGNSTILNSEGIVVYADVTEAGTADFVRTSTTDVITSISVNGNTIASVKNGESLLAADAYEVNAAGNVVLKATYLNTLRPGKYELTIRWNPFGESYEADSNGLSQAPNDTVLMLTVQGAAGSIRNILDQSKEYDGTAVSAPTFTTTNTYAADGVKVEYKKRSDAEAAYTTAVPKDAGDYTVRITVAADDTYNEVSETADFTIRQRKITVTASDASKHMEAADPELTYEITSGSLVKGESLNGIRISRAAGEDAASYEITASQEADANLNYEITFVKGTFTIEPHTAVNIAEVPATCTEAGKEAGKEAGTRCSVCDKVLSGLQEIPALGHDWSGAWKESEQGSKLNQREKSCARGCGAMKYEITPKLDELPVNTIAKIEFTKDVYEVPEAFKTDAKLDTTEKIKEQLKGYIALGYSEEHTQIYDVDLLISTDNGVTWTKADENLFPAEGLLVTLPYPEGTNAKGYDFSVVHMFTTSALGKTPGEVERPAVVKGADGLQFRVMGLSPVEVSWKAVPKKGSHSSGSHGKQEPTSVSAAPVNTINAVQSAHTGDNSMPLFWLCMIVLSGAAGIVIWRKRRKNV